ncbi:hypothetical protein BJ912DRAFT_298085 [Pholiota molesta]|nr:hypothetical protein BJ912DRAFT_298085 [Pholiota molesta]
MALHINDVRSREGRPAQDTLVALKLLELEYVVRRNWSRSDAQISCRPLDNIARQYRARGMGNEAGHTMWRAVGSTYSRARSPTTTIPPPTPHLHPFPTAHARRYDSPPTACYLRHLDSIPPKSSSCPDPEPAIADDAPRSAKGDDGTSSRHSVRELLADDINVSGWLFMVRHRCLHLRYSEKHLVTHPPRISTSFPSSKPFDRP